MLNTRAVITGVGAYLPEDVLTNDELARLVETSDEWIMTRIGIKERRIMKDRDKASAYMGAEAIKQLLEKTGKKSSDIDLLICATVTPDMVFPATANIISDILGIKNAFSFDINAGCSGFLFALTTATKYIETGFVKNAIVVGAEKMSTIVDYTDRTVCPIFGDGAAAVMVEATDDTSVGIVDSMLHVDGIGRKWLHQKAGGSLNPPTHDTIDARWHYIYQEGQPVFKYAVSNMADISVEMMNKHNISPDDLAWLVPHQANMRIIEATAKRMGISKEQVMINIHKYGNTTAATIPLLLWEWEPKLKKGDKLILSAFGAGFTWGAMYVVWGYDTK
jgi:3-oxoacyl-[acyl-carrier-protein] synthase-3